MEIIHISSTLINNAFLFKDGIDWNVLVFHSLKYGLRSLDFTDHCQADNMTTML